MANRWVGVSVIVAIVGGVLVLGTWQAVREQRRLARELTVTQSALVRLKQENVTVTAQLNQVQSDLDQVRSQQGELSSKLSAANEQVAWAEAQRQQMEAALRAMQAQEQWWLSEKTRLEDQISSLQRENGELEQRLSSIQITPSPSSAPRSKPSQRRSIPPTAGSNDASSGPGNRGYMIGGPTTSESAPQVRVLPAADEAVSAEPSPTY